MKFQNKEDLERQLKDAMARVEVLKKDLEVCQAEDYPIKVLESLANRINDGLVVSIGSRDLLSIYYAVINSFKDIVQKNKSLENGLDVSKGIISAQSLELDNLREQLKVTKAELLLYKNAVPGVFQKTPFPQWQPVGPWYAHSIPCSAAKPAAIKGGRITL